MNLSRVVQYGKEAIHDGAVLYWMNRECRVEDNWSLIFAQQLAGKNQQQVVVLYNLDPGFLGGGARQVEFKIQGLQQLEKELQALHIQLTVLVEKQSVTEVVQFIEQHNIGAVVTDFAPLRTQGAWVDHVSQESGRAVYIVDSHNIVPCWVASPKQEFAAYTIRPKIHTHLPEYLEEFPSVKAQTGLSILPIGWERIRAQCHDDQSILPVDWIRGGSDEAKRVLKFFIENHLEHYEQRNNPNAQVLSNLSSYFHYGHISAQRVALEIQKQTHVSREVREEFLEELIIRRELADNYCYYNPHYDSFDGFPDWAKKTLLEHAHDKRPYLYTEEEFESGKTHDPLWNAAQMEMVKRGKMHGYMRMYWAKKLLEWTHDPSEALRVGIYLNDRYQLDGRDPNGYVGLAWSIGGVHDRAWGERDVFGKIRYMNANGCKRKFDTEAYIRSVESL